jgi:hypothetical protein
MRLMLSLAAVVALGATPLMAGKDSFSEPPPGPRGGVYDRIVAHYGPMGRDVKEKFRDGPCKISRKWEKDGDYEEKISCRGPRD